MISIVICSRSSSIGEELQENIALTIGVPYELVVIDNSCNKYTIFEAYNLGVQKSKFPYLCFMHDDILYHTKDWGSKVINYFADGTTGAIGIAGSPYATYLPGSWWGGELVNETLMRVDGIKLKPTTKSIGCAFPSSGKTAVAVLDGVWLCIRKSIFSDISFDEESYTGFHFYDVDISLQIIAQGHQNYSINDIFISHSSPSNVNRNWCENALIFNKKWADFLPLSCMELNPSRKNEAELKTLKEYLYILMDNNYSRKTLYKIAFGRLLQFGKSFLHYRTPLYAIKFLYMIRKYGDKK